MTPNQPLILAAGETSASISPRGAELLSWSVRGRELIWRGDPAFWAYRAPILFPVVGASAQARVTVEGQSYPMPQHGFARSLDFDVVEHGADQALLRLCDSAETRRHFPFAFRLEVQVRVASEAVHLRFRVHNTGDRDMPYGLGYHPAFPWPFDWEGEEGHQVLFDETEEPEVPLLTGDGLLRHEARTVPMNQRGLPLARALFEPGALVFRNARSRRLRFVSPSGAAIALEAPSCPHLAVWTKPDAPFLSLETWTSHADWEGFSGALQDRASMRLVAPGAMEEHEMSLRWFEAPAGV